MRVASLRGQIQFAGPDSDTTAASSARLTLPRAQLASPSRAKGNVDDRFVAFPAVADSSQSMEALEIAGENGTATLFGDRKHIAVCQPGREVVGEPRSGGDLDARTLGLYRCPLFFSSRDMQLLVTGRLLGLFCVAVIQGELRRPE